MTAFPVIYSRELFPRSRVQHNVIRKILLLAAVSVLALPLIHPFGPVRQQRSESPLPDLPLVKRACQNCHSERTEWPLYSHLPVVSWLIERDVADARSHMNLSRWASYSSDQKRDLLAGIAAEVRNREMPPPRYTTLHPEARLSPAEIEAIYEWTKTQRHNLRPAGINQGTNQGINQGFRESSVVPQ